jgi:hypothetical protein
MPSTPASKHTSLNQWLICGLLLVWWLLQAGAEEIKKHPWFEGLNWALLRHREPPYVPRKVQQQAAAAEVGSAKASSVDSGGAAAAAAFDNY